MPDRKPLTPEEISAIVDRFEPINAAELELLAMLPPGMRCLPGQMEAERIRAELRAKFMEEFPDLSLPEINMMVLRSLTPVIWEEKYYQNPKPDISHPRLD